ncbi:LPS assembly lipoprotein LptE [Methylovirgula sp. HY1]|uniref:LPS assembly lipoprotein LptE n=1 Tax=Methylovirgula sp. HY1 TaxID=2822761 RepID=UPI002107454B|nr:LPS assembly lipoprotein LptE [Methylovirgula sp. HY1]
MAFLPALFLAGCLHPLYGSVGASAKGAKVVEELKAIEIAPIPARLGHYLGDDLIFALNGTGSHVLPKYKLTLTASEGVQTPLIDTVTGLATSATVMVTVNYTLMPIAGVQKPIAHGIAFYSASYDRTSERYSNVQAGLNAEQRDARILADQIRTQIAAALATQT